MTHISGAKFTASVEIVTPAMAQELLNNQVSNQRNLNMGRATRYAEDMSHGFWEVTHQGVAVDEEGRLMDGQHRLKAVVISNRPVEMLVFRGVPSDYFYLVDGGFSRNAQSFLTGPYTSLRAALARFMLALTESNGLADGSTTRPEYPSHRVLRFLESREDIQAYGTEFAGAAGRTATRRKFCGTSATGLLIGGFIAGFDGKSWSREKSQAWWDDINAVVNGEGLDKSNPVRALYKAAENGMTQQCYLRSVYAAVRYRDGIKLSLIRDSNCNEIQVW